MGKSELEVSEVGFGVWTLASGRWGSFTDDQAVDLLHKAYDAGINYFDVSPTDGGGRGERLIGQAFGDKRELVIVSSKVGRSATGTDFSPPSIRKALEGTLERLGSSYVDVLQLHYPDAPTVANAAVWQTLEALKGEARFVTTESPSARAPGASKRDGRRCGSTTSAAYRRTTIFWRKNRAASSCPWPSKSTRAWSSARPTRAAYSGPSPTRRRSRRRAIG